MATFHSRLLPQANVLAKVTGALGAVSRGHTSFQGIASYLRMHERQGRYYRLAAETMGLLENSRNHATVTPLGQEYLSATGPAKARVLRRAVARNPVIYEVLQRLTTSDGGWSNQDLFEFVRDNTAATGQTPSRRASTIRGWLVGSGLARERQGRLLIVRPAATEPGVIGVMQDQDVRELPPKPRDELTALSVDVDVAEFDPTGVEDARRRTMQAIYRRRGQPAFRRRLLDAYGGRCAVTGCDVANALEAVHITPYRGPETNHPANGLLLRADLHTLFDYCLISIDHGTMTVVIAPSLKGTAYEDLAGRLVSTPTEPNSRPSAAALQEQRQRAGI